MHTTQSSARRFWQASVWIVLVAELVSTIFEFDDSSLPNSEAISTDISENATHQASVAMDGQQDMEEASSTKSSIAGQPAGLEHSGTCTPVPTHHANARFLGTASNALLGAKHSLSVSDELMGSETFLIDSDSRIKTSRVVQDLIHLIHSRRPRLAQPRWKLTTTQTWNC